MRAENGKTCEKSKFRKFAYSPGSPITTKGETMMRTEIINCTFTESKTLHDELTALRAFVREVSQQDPAQVPGQRQSNKERAEDLCEQWGITE